MGADGGSISKRTEMIKLVNDGGAASKSQAQKSQFQQQQLEIQWRECSLTRQPLKAPIVADKYGKLYNKEAIIKHLLEFQMAKIEQDVAIQPQVIKGVKRMRDVTELHFNRADKFECRVTARIMDGAVPFVFLKPCGCVMTQATYQQLMNKSEVCVVCSQTVTSCQQIYPPDDVVASDVAKKSKKRQRDEK